ncbi:hypothetical protein NEMBOFW57_000241 [Staphylotrichum longicolle]|uniref:Cytoplasmic tRNA 2-thiolation protein 2 n=1 Tax=Staphylotrichum longicolle TaxID=669026 RepID=A0AAD4F3Q7_9PEZI|nr:hypothetical protein NEMBOFW57_000241 [Staphylotrichum longicolle]
MTDSKSAAGDCFTKFIATKCIKQIGILGKETRPPPSTTGGPPTGTRRYLLGLSLGVSSTVLLHLLNENVEFQLAKGRNAPFDLTVVHVDTSPQPPSSSTTSHTQTAAETALAAYRARYPRFAFHCIPLSSSSSSTSTSTSTTTTSSTTTAAALLQGATTSAASRSDILRTLTRRALISAARAHTCQALLLGHSTTALAELTLAEAAKGRGFALPWLVHDGPAPAPAPAVGGGVGVGAGVGDGDVDRSSLGLRGNGDGEGEVGAGTGSLEDAGAGASANGGGEGSDVDDLTVLVYHPLRDALRKELVTYASLVSPPLTDLIPPDHPHKTKNGDAPPAAAVVSHKDLSIEEVMTRYFAEVEASYPSVVANVARTTGKLVRAGGTEGCALCGMPLDEDGDERWRGELGIQKETATSGVGGTGGRLCYGCERSTGA